MSVLSAVSGCHQAARGLTTLLRSRRRERVGPAMSRNAIAVLYRRTRVGSQSLGRSSSALYSVRHPKGASGLLGQFGVGVRTRFVVNGGSGTGDGRFCYRMISLQVEGRQFSDFGRWGRRAYSEGNKEREGLPDGVISSASMVRRCQTRSR